MRVAGEKAYEQLIDFATTVMWRPRYFSFFCWATRKAFLEAGGKIGSFKHLVDAKLYRRTLKRIEYAMAAATLLNDHGVLRIAGSTKVDKALSDLEETGGTSLTLRGDHLRADRGGLNIYAGPMRDLGLLVSAKGLDVPLPGSTGDQLADCFARTLALYSDKDFSSNSAASLDTLVALGRCCGLSRLSEQADRFEEVLQERALLREIVVDWSAFGGGFGLSARRILSIGLILESRKLYPEEPASLNRFRELILLGAIKIPGKTIPLELPSIYGQILNEWRLYQVHAYITYALESLLGVVLSFASDMQADFGDAIPYTQLVGTIIDALPTGEKQPRFELPVELREWWALPLKELEVRLRVIVTNGRDASLVEPELHAAIEGLVRDGRTSQPSAWYHNAALMYLVATVRLRLLIEHYGEEAWLGSKEPFRLPPLELIRHFTGALRSDIKVQDYLRHVLNDLVTQQHRANALRKLVSDPTIDTAKFILEGFEIIPLNLHQPGTSNPRFNNAVLFLQELGYLTSTTSPKVTSDGDEVLERIRRGG
jgi:hypothetical protein